MQLFPQREFVIHTNLTTEEIRNKLEKHTEAGRSLFPYNRKKTCYGEFYENGFRVEATGIQPEGYFKRNSFTPINKGEYKETENGVDIIVTQELSNSTLIFGVFTMLVLLFIAAISLEVEPFMAITALAMEGGAIAMTRFGFASAAQVDQEIMERILSQ